MLDLDFIKDNTIWVLKHDSGYRETGTYKDLSPKADKSDDIKDFDIVAWEGQPKELQPFYKAYEYANYTLKLHLFSIEEFYNEYIKNPNQFEADHKPVITQLLKTLEELDPTDDLIIENYDGYAIGNHHVGNYIEALKIMDYDFDVINDTEKYNYHCIIIQSDDQEKLRDFSYKSNESAIHHDRYMGDGKYWKK